LSGTPVAGLIVVHPSVEFKAIEADPLPTYRNFGEVRPGFDVEPVAIHTKVVWGIAEADDAGLRDATVTFRL
jgi:hypothetical protein